MKHFLVTAGIVVRACMTVAVLGIVSSAYSVAADEGHPDLVYRALDEQGSGGPLETVKALHEALSSGSAAGVEKVLDAKVLIMEGGNVERSWQEYAAHHLASDLKFMSGFTYKLQRQSAGTVGDLAWVASEISLVPRSATNPKELLNTESLVLRKTPDGWKIVHIHWSSRSLKQE